MESSLELGGPLLGIEVLRPPGTAGIYARALLRAAGRRQGELPEGRRVGPVEVRQPGVRLARRKVELFREVCGHGPGEEVPATYPETLFLGLMAEAVLSEAFPFSPFGLIHTRQRIEQVRPLSLDEATDLSCRLAAVRRTDRGFEVDFGMEASVGDVRAWKGTATLLTRSAATRRRKGGSRREVETGDEGFHVSELDVPADTGRRYAAASDDYSPHHLYAVTARLLGYRRPIAHGMWTLARAISHVGGQGASEGRVVIEASFKKPVLMPARVRIRHREREGGIDFDVRHAREGTPHLLGTLEVT